MEWISVIIDVPHKWQVESQNYLYSLGFSITHIGGNTSIFLAEALNNNFDYQQTNVFFYFEPTPSVNAFYLKCKENCITPIEYRKKMGLTKKTYNPTQNLEFSQEEN